MSLRSQISSGISRRRANDLGFLFRWSCATVGLLVILGSCKSAGDSVSQSPGSAAVAEALAIERYLEQMTWTPWRAPCERLPSSYDTTIEVCATDSRIEVALRTECLRLRPELMNDAGERLVVFDGSGAVYRFENQTHKFVRQDWRSCDGGPPRDRH
jgi:hypothetical protein